MTIRVKVFLRSLGIGLLAAVVVVGCVMLVQSGRSQNKTDNKDSDKLVTEMPLESGSEETPAASDPAAVQTEEAAVTQTPVVTESAAPVATEPVAGQTAVPTAEAGTNQAETKTVEITRGADSETVARKLEEAGIIDDAEDFNQYLEQGGYSNRIMMGTYELTPGEAYASLAKKIAGESK